MGKPAGSCLKIIVCGSDSVDHDDLQAPESKGSSGRRWSFHKRSPMHRSSSNTVISETSAAANKETLEPTALNFQEQPNSTVPEKTSLLQWTKVKTELSPHLDTNESDDLASNMDDCRSDATVDENSVIVIQAAIKGLLARRVLLKQKSIIKLQAAVRGHLVRKHAIGTFRCVRAIIKMQALVRARQARLFVQGSGSFEKQSENNGQYNRDSTLLISKRETNPHGTSTYVSVEKLLRNKFARQLMESTPRNGPINIKCDPLKSNSAWDWLERWMSVSYVSNGGVLESGSAVEKHEKKENHEFSEGNKDILVPSDCSFESTDLNSGMDKSEEAFENDDNLITYEANNLNVSLSESSVTASSHLKLQSNDDSNLEAKSLPDEEIGNEHNITDPKKFSTDQPETEAKKLLRKASNPSFIAVQTKFEELTSACTSKKLTTSSSHDFKAESVLDKVSSSPENALVDISISNFSAVQFGGSECGTGLSGSFPLDLPDKQEIELNKVENEPKNSHVIDNSKSTESLGLESSGKSSGKPATGEFISSSIPVESSKLEKNTEADPMDMKLEPQLEDKSSPAASLRSFATVTESQVTPCNQPSTKSKKSTIGKTESTRKSRSSSGKKNCHSSPHQDSGLRSSRQNSFGCAKADNTDQEPRNNSGSNSLPSYMQATESAKAKVIANGSPRSSYDVHEIDIYIKKRHSLPGTDGKQRSPRIQRSLSQAQHNARGNGTNSSQERKWLR